MVEALGIMAKDVDNMQQLMGCSKCNRAIDHERNEFGLWSCIDCGKIRD